jgi:HD-GYP domain-containing protein (c-di-GMP phosphodiesterase class II)
VPQDKCILSVFNNVNKHCLDKIVSLSEENTIIASEDIYDQNGTKLWAKGNRISAALQEKLASRTLKTPLEVSLEIEQSVSPSDVVEDCQKLIQADPCLSRLAGTRAALATLSQLRLIKLPGGLRLLLSAAVKGDEKSYRHILYTTAICAGFATKADLPVGDTQVLLAAAMLHDIGEVYINPEYLRSNRPLAAKEWSAVAAHPKVGYMVSLEIGKLKEDVALGIYHHHERLDGSGYPAMVTREKISKVGAIVAGADGTAAILERAGEGAAYQAALAIRIIPEEFNADMRSFVCGALRDIATAGCNDEHCLAQTKWMIDKLTAVEADIAELLPKAIGKVREALVMSQNVCVNVHKAIHATGIDFLLQAVTEAEKDQFCGGEVCHIIRETGWRLRNLARTIQLRAYSLPEVEQALLSDLIALLESRFDAPMA